MEIVNIVARRFKINYIYDGIKIEPRKIEKKQGYSKNTSAFVDTVEKMKMMQLNSSLPSNSQTHVFLGISSQNLVGNLYRVFIKKSTISFKDFSAKT